MRYNPALDGLRAVAVMMVLAYHARIPGSVGGYLGVDVFFVLSGYLITRILADQHQKTGTIALVSFYGRRLRRLYPALLLLLAVYAVAAWAVWPAYAHHGRDMLITAAYLADYGFAFWRAPWYLQHTWSLSVEEHFYLVWPLVLMGVLRLPRRYWAATVLGLALAATVWRWHMALYVNPWQEPYYRFDTRLSGLLLGSAAALWNPRVNLLGALAGASLLVLAVSQAAFREDGGLTIWMAAAEVGSLLLVLGSSHLPVLAWSPLVWIGKLSYGIYLWHFPIMIWLRAEGTTGWPALALGGGGAVLCATISYFTVERLARSRPVHRVEGTGAGQVGALGRDPGIR